MRYESSSSTQPYPGTRQRKCSGSSYCGPETSVGANYREASRGRSKAEFISKIGDCLREIDESEYWLELLADNNSVPRARLANILDETRQLIAIFTSIDKKAKGQR